MNIELMETVFNNKMHKYYQDWGYPPTDCVMPCWMIEELKAKCEKILKDKMSKDTFEYRGIRLHPSCEETDMYFYRAFNIKGGE